MTDQIQPIRPFPSVDAEVIRLRELLWEERNAHAHAICVPLIWFILLVLFAALGLLFVGLEGLAYVL